MHSDSIPLQGLPEASRDGIASKITAGEVAKSAAKVVKIMGRAIGLPGLSSRETLAGHPGKPPARDWLFGSFKGNPGRKSVEIISLHGARGLDIAML